MKYDIRKLKSEINATSRDIRRLKSLRDESRRPNWKAGMERELMQLQHRATRLCMLRSHLRGRLHIADSRAWLERQVRSYVTINALSNVTVAHDATEQERQFALIKPLLALFERDDDEMVLPAQADAHQAAE